MLTPSLPEGPAKHCTGHTCPSMLSRPPDRLYTDPPTGYTQTPRQVIHRPPDRLYTDPQHASLYNKGGCSQ
ncbi:hypothetical protein FKM82_028506 [Ascaphus truei]